MSGAERMLQNQKNGTSSPKVKKLDPDINGMAGEIAVAKYFNRYPDFSVGPHRRGYDLVVAGRKVDVKTTTYQRGFLQVKAHKKIEDADIYVLVYANIPEYVIMGGAYSHELIQQQNIKDTGYGPYYTFEHSQLKSMEELWRNKYAQPQ